MSRRALAGASMVLLAVAAALAEQKIQEWSHGLSAPLVWILIAVFGVVGLRLAGSGSETDLEPTGVGSWLFYNMWVAAGSVSFWLAFAQLFGRDVHWFSEAKPSHSVETIGAWLSADWLVDASAAASEWVVSRAWPAGTVEHGWIVLVGLFFLIGVRAAHSDDEVLPIAALFWMAAAFFGELGSPLGLWIVVGVGFGLIVGFVGPALVSRGPLWLEGLAGKLAIGRLALWMSFCWGVVFPARAVRRLVGRW